MSIQGGVRLGDLSDFTGLLTVLELAKKLGVHPDTIRRWENKGRISSVRHPINNYRLFKLSELVNEVLSNEKKGSWLRARVIEGTGTRGLLNTGTEETDK